MAKYALRKPALGIDQLSDETGLAADAERGVTAVREAVNVDVDDDGNMSRRSGYTSLLSGSGYHSLYSSKRGWLMLCNKQQLGVYTPDTGVFSPLVDMLGDSLTSFAELNGHIYFCNVYDSGIIRANEQIVRPLGVPLPNVQVSFSASATGGLAAGTYVVTYSYVNDLGEESPLAPYTKVELTSDGGIVGTPFTTAVGKYRIYMTDTDGEELYQVAEFDADTASYTVTSFEEGRHPRTKGLDVMPFGYHIRAYNSRLFIGTNDFVYFSEAFMPHLYNPGHNFLPCTGFVYMVQPVDTGIYIADQAGVRFYAGDDPTTFSVKEVSDEPVVFGSGISVPGDYFSRDLGGSDHVAVWLSPSGYQVGLPSGEVARLHTRQVQLPRYVQGCASINIKDGRKQVITAVNSNKLANASVALDSSIS